MIITTKNTNMRNESARKRKPMRENRRNPLDEIPSSRMRVIELDNGDYYYLNYENGMLQAGHTTNNGFYPEYEIEYDWDFSLDHNIESLYDKIEDNFHFESVSKGRKKARRVESMRVGKLAEKVYVLKGGDALRKAEQLNDIDKVRNTLLACYDELYGNGVISEDDYDYYTDEVETETAFPGTGKEEIASTIQYLVSNFYELCEYYGVRVPLSARESMRVGTRPRVRKPIRKESMGSHLAEYQKWVDYDMERYGRISDRTMDTIRKAGLSVVKDQYGEYEVIAYDRKESLNRTHRPVKEKTRKRMREGWRGHPDIEMIWHGAWADPDLEYKGYIFNYWDIEDAMWEDFLESTGHKDSEADDPKVEKEFNQYVIENAAYYLDDIIAGGYFERNGKKYKSWHDMMHERFNRTPAKKSMRESMHRFNRHPVNRRK